MNEHMDLSQLDEKWAYWEQRIPIYANENAKTSVRMKQLLSFHQSEHAAMGKTNSKLFNHTLYSCCIQLT